MTVDFGTYIKKREEWEKKFFKYGLYGKNEPDDNPLKRNYEPPTSRKYKYLLNSLSKTMKEGLKSIIEEKENIPKKTINALRKRNLLNETEKKIN